MGGHALTLFLEATRTTLQGLNNVISWSDVDDRVLHVSSLSHPNTTDVAANGVLTVETNEASLPSSSSHISSSFGSVPILAELHYAGGDRLGYSRIRIRRRTLWVSAYFSAYFSLEPLFSSPRMQLMYTWWSSILHALSFVGFQSSTSTIQKTQQAIQCNIFVEPCFLSWVSNQQSSCLALKTIDRNPFLG
jgi:hypothetical protein